MSWCHAAVALAPVVADSIGKDCAVAVEGCTWHGSGRRVEGFQTRPGVLVPEVDGAIRAASRERPLLRVEGDVVHSEDEGLVLRIRRRVLAVALEREVVLRVLVLDVSAQSL